jgi:hypothetical protein
MRIRLQHPNDQITAFDEVPWSRVVKLGVAKALSKLHKLLLQALLSLLEAAQVPISERLERPWGSLACGLALLGPPVAAV